MGSVSIAKIKNETLSIPNYKKSRKHFGDSNFACHIIFQDKIFEIFHLILFSLNLSKVIHDNKTCT